MSTPAPEARSESALQRGGLGASGAALFAGTMSANILAYAFFLILSRHLTEADFGGVGSIINLSLIASVPALGLQLVAARIVARAHAAHDEAALRDADGKVVRLGLQIGALVTVLLAALSPALAGLLHLSVTSVVVLAVAAGLMSVTFAVQGILQGEERFGALALVYALTGVTRLVAAVVAVLAGQSAPQLLSVLGVTVLFALGWVVTAGVALLLLPRHQRRPVRASTRTMGREVVTAVVSTSGLLVLSSFDVLLARHHLDLDASGAYTLGALFEKAGFWGPAFLSTLFYPRMAVAATRRRAIVTALGVTGAAGAVGVLVTVVLGGPLVRIVGGERYDGLAGDVWLFAAFGVCLALVQVLVYAGLAVDDIRLGAAAWVVVAVDVVLLQWRHGGVVDIIATLLVSAVILIGVGLVLTARPRRGRRADLSVDGQLTP